jgi:predicted transcriptional regulator
MHTLAKVKAEDIMSPDLATVYPEDEVRYLASRSTNKRFIFFVADDDENVVGVLTDREAEPAIAASDSRRKVADVMVSTREVATATPTEDGASLLQRMEADSIWHLPVVKEGRVIGVVSKESLLRLLARNFIPRPQMPTSQAGPAA